MKNFNAQYGKHSRLELLKHFILEHGTYIELKKGEQFSVQGKMNRRGAYIENGLLRYIHVDERGNIHIVGYTFSNEFAGSLCTFINPDRPSLVTIEAVCDSKIYYLPYSTAEEFFTTNAETMQIKCTLVEQSYLLMYHRLLDMYCKTTEELYLDFPNVVNIECATTFHYKLNHNNNLLNGNLKCKSLMRNSRIDKNLPLIKIQQKTNMTIPLNKKLHFSVYGSYTLDKKRSVILPATSIPYKVGAGFSYEIGKHAIIKSQTNYQYNIIQKKWEWFFGAGVFFTF